jgi:hypothetical protein
MDRSMAIDYLLRFVLQFSQDYIVFSFLILGILFMDRKLFQRIAILLLLGIVINLVLKNVFQIPLKPHLPQGGYAFPSGHAQLTATFYGYLAYVYYPYKWFRWIAGLVIGGTSIALVHFHYHDWIDVVGALMVALAWCSLFEVLRVHPFFRGRFDYFALLFLIPVILLGCTALKLPSNYLMVSGSYAGVCCGLWIEHRMGYGQHRKVVEVLIVIVGGAFLYFTLAYLLTMGVVRGSILLKQLGLFALYAFPVGWIICGPAVVSPFCSRNPKK